MGQQEEEVAHERMSEDEQEQRQVRGSEECEHEREGEAGNERQLSEGGIKLLGLGSKLCVKGAGVVWGNTTIMYGPILVKLWCMRLSKSVLRVDGTFGST
jgi:hypothetical protein